MESYRLIDNRWHIPRIAVARNAFRWFIINN